MTIFFDFFLNDCDSVDYVPPEHVNPFWTSTLGNAELITCGNGLLFFFFVFNSIEYNICIVLYVLKSVIHSNLFNFFFFFFQVI